MSKTKLVVIDGKTNTYAAYEGKTRVDRAVFSRPMLADEVEHYRVDPLGFGQKEVSEDVA